MVEVPDTEPEGRKHPFRPGLPAMVAAVVVVIVGLAVFPSQDPPAVEPVSSEALPDPLTEASLLTAPATPVEVEVAELFMEAWVGGDGQAAAANFTSDGLFQGLGEYEPGMLPVLRDWYRSLGQFQKEGCDSFPQMPSSAATRLRTS